MTIEKIECDICKKKITKNRYVFKRLTICGIFEFGLLEKTYDICQDCLDDIRKLKARKEELNDDNR